MADSNDEVTHYDEDTLKKVYRALLEAGIYGQQAVDAVENMKASGIFFRERKPKRRGRPAGSKNREKNLEERVLDQTHGVDRTEEIEADLQAVEAPQEGTGDAWSPLGGANGA